MTVSVRKPVLVDPIVGNSWRVSWSSTLSDPEYRVYRDGREIARTRQESIVVTAGDGESVTLEVRDDALDPTYAMRSRLDLAWDATANTKAYRIERYVGAAWTLVGVKKDDGRANYRFKTPPLSDSASHQFRIVPVGDDGNKGTPVTVAFPLARHPMEPDIDMTYAVGTGLVTVAAN